MMMILYDRWMKEMMDEGDDDDDRWMKEMMMQQMDEGDDDDDVMYDKHDPLVVKIDYFYCYSCYSSE